MQFFLRRMFEGVSPALTDLNITLEGVHLVALCFETSRMPHVVKNPDHGTIPGVPEFEVPWREGTRTRSATRNELLLMLSPIVKIPKVEVLEGDIRFVPMATNPISTELRFRLKLYVVPLSSGPLTFPFHKCAALLSAQGQIISDRFDLSIDTPLGNAKKAAERRRMILNAATAPPDSNFNIIASKPTMDATAEEITVQGPGMMEISGSYGILAFDSLPELDLMVTLVEAVTEAKVVLSCKFSKRQTNDKGLIWTLNK
jgi:hypothetical protein